jgi:hypothetical protein
MKLIIRRDRGRWRWFAEFKNYNTWLIGDVKKMPTAMDALRIVRAWKIRVIDGMPYHNYYGPWVPFGTRP